MKAILFVLMIALALFYSVDMASEIETPRLTLELVMEVDDPVYSVGYALTRGQSTLCGGGATRADGHAFADGESVFLAFDEEAFATIGPTDGVTVGFCLYDENERSYPCAGEFPLADFEDGVCRIDISGDYEHGFMAEMTLHRPLEETTDLSAEAAA